MGLGRFKLFSSSRGGGVCPTLLISNRTNGTARICIVEDDFCETVSEGAEDIAFPTKEVLKSNKTVSIEVEEAQGVFKPLPMITDGNYRQCGCHYAVGKKPEKFAVVHVAANQADACRLERGEPLAIFNLGQLHLSSIAIEGLNLDL
jgi:hypothetical protein